MEILVKEPFLPPKVRSLTEYAADILDALQSVVGGYIETVFINDKICLICNEEGKLRGLPPNVILEHNGRVFDVVAGSVAVAAIDGEDLRELTAKELVFAIDWLKRHSIWSRT